MTEQLTIEEKNVILARFEEWLFYGKYIDKYGPGTSNVYPDLKYHSDWSWLMRVGKKIFELLQEMMKDRPPHTCCKGDLIEVDISCAIRVYDIEKAHEAIFQFIQWHNQQLAKKGLVNLAHAIAEDVCKDEESAKEYLESEGVDVAKLEDDAKYLSWKAHLMALVTQKTGYTAFINDQQAREWYDSGATPEQCFRETWESDGD